MFLAVFATSLEETLEDGSSRTLKLPSVLAPTKAAVLPLVKKR
jgi:glycyl-tRNA synthetase